MTASSRYFAPIDLYLFLFSVFLSTYFFSACIVFFTGPHKNPVDTLKYITFLNLFARLQINEVLKGYGFLIFLGFFLSLKILQYVVVGSEGVDLRIRRKQLFAETFAVTLFVWWYVFIVVFFVPFILELSSGYRISRHCFLCLWIILNISNGTHQVYCRFRKPFTLKLKRSAVMPFLLLVSTIMALSVFCMLVSLYLLIQTLLFFHTFWEKIAGLSLAMGGHVLLQFAYILLHEPAAQKLDRSHLIL